MKKLTFKQKSLAEIFKMKNKKSKIEKGGILIISILVLGLMLFLGAYFISFGLTGSKMAQSHKAATQTYYLAEAGVGETIFKLKTDPTWKSAFETQPTVEDPTCSFWSIPPYQRTGDLFENGSYTVTVTNLGCAKAELASVATIQLGEGKTSQRIVKAKVFKAIGNPVSDFNVFTGGSSENIEIKFTDPLNIHNGNIFSNSKIKLRYWSRVVVDNKALAGNNILLSENSQLIATSCAANMCDSGCATSTECPPEQVSMPPLDFDSDDPGSFLSRAKNSDCSLIRTDGKINCVFTPEEFEKLMWQNYPALSLPTSTITYVTGDVNIRASQQLTVNGVLVADRDFSLGEDFCWTRPDPPFLWCGSAQLTVKRPGSPEDNLSSGILAKRKINAGGWLGIGVKALDITGLIYAGDEMRLSAVAAPIEIHGGIAVRKFTLSSMWEGVDIHLDSDVIIDTFGSPTYSPMVVVDHWEEEY